jgi:hypothetical protein
MRRIANMKPHPRRGHVTTIAVAVVGASPHGGGGGGGGRSGKSSSRVVANPWTISLSIEFKSFVLYVAR